MEIPLAFSLEAKDVGATIALTLRVNSKPIISWMAGTRHADLALKVGIDAVANICRELLLTSQQIAEYDVEEAEARIEGSPDWGDYL